MFTEGDKATHFHLLLDGHVRVVRTNADGEQIIVLHIHSGGLFGIAPALGRSTYPASAVAAGEIITLAWPVAVWPGFIRELPNFAGSTYGTVGQRVEEMNTRIMEMATQQVEQRIASALLRMVQQSGRKASQGVVIGFPITRQNVADMTGSTLHTVSRLLSAWERDGVIASARRQITVCNPHALVQIAGHAPR